MLKILEMKNLYKFSIALLPFAFACNPADKPQEKTNAEENNFSYFSPVSANDTTQTLIIPEGFKYDILFREKLDMVTRADGKTFPSKGKQDFTAYLPIEGSSEHGYLYVNHETHNLNDGLGDGGGGSVFEVKKENGTWKVVGNFKHIDFEPVGGTMRNCGGTKTPHGTILTAEEHQPPSNKSLEGEYRDTSDYNGMKRHENFGWMVEVDPTTAKVVAKQYALGRYDHEDAFCTPDGKTLYMTDDSAPAVLFKFEAETPHDYSKGQLYAFKEATDNETGEWVKLPMERDSLIQARLMAIKRGATLFVRHEWIEMVDGKLYITETGRDEFNWDEPIAYGGKPASYFESHRKEGNVFNDPFGRVVEIDLATMKAKPYVEGGPSSDGSKHFSSPDGLCQITLDGKTYLVISEDLTGISQGRVSKKAEAKDEKYNEVYWIEAGLENASVDNLQRFAVGPRGCETTGGEFTPDGKTFFLSIQSPDKNNAEPFKRSTVVAITGF